MDLQSVLDKFLTRPAQKDLGSRAGAKEAKRDRPQQNTKRSPARQRREQKQQEALLQLKIEAAAPEAVQIDDCNAPDPSTLVWMRAQPGIVDVPVHWRASSGRFLHKRVRANNIADFKIPSQYLQQALQRKQQTDKLKDQSVKQLARSELKVPASSTTIYVVPESEFVDTNEYLPAGEVFYQGRLSELKYRFEVAPGQLSERLKAALALKDGEEYPWEVRRRTLGIK